MNFTAMINRKSEFRLANDKLYTSGIREFVAQTNLRIDPQTVMEIAKG